MQRRPTQTPQLLWRYAPTPRLFAARVVSTACLHPHRKAHQRYYSVYAKVVASTMETSTQLFWDRNHPSPCDKRLFFTSMVLSQSSLVLFSCMNIEAWYILCTKTYMISWMFSLPHITTQESSHDTTPACQRDKTLKTLDLKLPVKHQWMLTPNGFTIFAELFSHRFMLKHLYQHDVPWTKGSLLHAAQGLCCSI